MKLTTFFQWRPFACSLMVVSLLAIPGDASSTKDQAFEPSPPDTIPTVFSNLHWAQTFTVGATGTLTSVEVLVAQQFKQQPEDLEITIFDTAGGAPNAPLTAPAHVSPANIPIVIHPADFGTYAYLSAQVSLAVTAGDVLAIVVSTGPMSQYYWAGAFGGGYPRGRLYRTNGGAWFADGVEDQAFRTFVAPSRPPTANAGINQTARQGTMVNLDGSGSYDDNTPTNLLHYDWTLTSVPTGSAVTTVTGATTMTPSFVPDLAGDYVVQLVVTDQDGLSSQPSRVTIGENPPPMADAGPDQVAITNHPVVLNGSAIDPDGDAIGYGWQFTGKPAGSSAQLVPSNSATTTFIPDLPGAYVATLTPSDWLGPGVPSSTTITVITGTTYAEMQVQTAAALLEGLPVSAVTNRGNQNALLQSLSHAATALQNNDVAHARLKLDEAITRTDGCARQGAPEGNGPGRDWITTCAAQEQVYPPLAAALAAIVSEQ